MSTKQRKSRPHPRQLANPTNWVKNLGSRHGKYNIYISFKHQNQSDG